MGEANTENHIVLEQKPNSREQSLPSVGTGATARKLRYSWGYEGGSVRTPAIKNSEETQALKCPTLLWSLPLELYQVLTTNIREKPLQASRREREKEAFWNISEHALLKVCPRKNLLNQSLTPWSFIST